MLGSSILKAFMENRGYNAAERIMMCAFIAISGTFYFYDYYQSFSEIARLVITVLIFVIWFWCSFCAGKDKQFGFITFGYLYWVIPFVYVLFYNSRDNVRGYSKWLSLFNKIADMILVKPFEFIAGKTASDPMAFACVVLGGSTILFVLGYVLRLFYERRTSPDDKARNVHEIVEGEHTETNESEMKNLNDFLGLD